MKKSQIKFKPSASGMRKLKREWVQTFNSGNTEAEIACPLCGARIHVKADTTICPKCGGTINAFTRV